MRLTIIIPCFNELNTIDAIIDAVNSAPYPDKEIIIVDDGSTDHSREIIKEQSTQFPVVKPIYQENGEYISAVIAGILSSTGDILFFFDADDASKATHFEWRLTKPLRALRNIISTIN